MATINPQLHLRGGIAGKSADTITADQVDFVAGDWPMLNATAETYALGEDFEALQVVGFDSDGNVTASVINNVDPADDVLAVGVVPYAITGGAAVIPGELYRSGNFNPERLVWDASYATDAEKRKAFEGAPSPSQCVVTPTRTFAV